MNQSDFLLNLWDYSTADGFSFLAREDEFQVPKRQSAGMQVVMGAMAAVGYGVIGSMSTGYLDKTDKNKLIADLKRMSEYGQLVGVKFSNGPVFLRLGINADDISIEALVGRFALIHERAHEFRKYAPSFLSNVFSDGKLGTFVHVVVAFSAHKKAREFTQNFAAKCRHTAFWKKVYTQPWVVDLEDEDEDITRFRPAITDFMARDSEKLKAGLFRVRDEAT